MWTFREDEEFAEMMEDYPRVEPIMERIFRQDEEQQRLRDEIRAIHARVKRLERADK